MKEIKFTSKIIPDNWLGHFDMLRDKRRNKGYYLGIKSFQINDNNSLNNEYWIDIGCGSGLLGCLVGKYLQKQVIAFECIPKLAKIARNTIRINNLQEYVTVWLVHTSDLDKEFMERSFQSKASYLISELLDTTLLGEGLYDGLKHAYLNLLQKPLSTIPKHINTIPHFARVFIQGWSGDCISNRQNLNENILSKIGLDKVISNINNCIPSSASTIQWNYFSEHGAIPITYPIEIFNFDFIQLGQLQSSKNTIIIKPYSNIFQELEKDQINLNVIVMYWICCCCVETTESTVCSNSFHSHHSNSNSDDHKDLDDYLLSFHSRGNITSEFNLRTDHWRQAVFFLNSNQYQLSLQDNLQITCCQNEDDIWIENIQPISSQHLIDHLSYQNKIKDNEDNEDILRPICMCGLHSSLSSFQIKELHSNITIEWIQQTFNTIDRIIDHIKLNVKYGGIILFVSDHVLCSVAIAKYLQTKESELIGINLIIQCVYTSSFTYEASRLLYDSYISSNYIRNHIQLLNISSNDENKNDNDENDDNDVEIILKYIKNSINYLKNYNKSHENNNENSIENTVLYLLHSIPYLNYLHDESTLEHIFQLKIMYDEIINEYNKKSLGLISSNINFIDDSYFITIWCGLFTSESLWRQYTGEIGIVEGIDMSSINELMEEIPSQQTEMKSLRLSQWDIDSLDYITSLGTFPISFLSNFQQVDDQEIFWEGKETITFTSTGNYHGICIFTSIQNTSGDSILSSNPILFPDSIQYFRCFNNELIIENINKLEISIKLMFNYKLLISVS